MKILSEHDAMVGFDELIVQVQGKPVAIEQNGKPVAVMMSASEYDLMKKLKEEIVTQEFSNSHAS